MKMSRLEKVFVNRESKGRENYARLMRRTEQLALPTAPRVLELGCGIGTVSAQFAEDNPTAVVLGTDSDPGQVSAARHRYGSLPNLHFREADAEALPFASASFDLVVAQNVFHHLPRWPAAVAEVARVLRPGAWFLWFDFALPPALRRLCSPLAGSAGVYTFEEIRAAFAAHRLALHAHAPARLFLFTHHDTVLRRAA
jgi:ubiquinone/menaquinone biosynthesis C-methylase UbiE